MIMQGVSCWCFHGLMCWSSSTACMRNHIECHISGLPRRWVAPRACCNRCRSYMLCAWDPRRTWQHCVTLMCVGRLRLARRPGCIQDAAGNLAAAQRAHTALRHAPVPGHAPDNRCAPANIISLPALECDLIHKVRLYVCSGYRHVWWQSNTAAMGVPLLYCCDDAAVFLHEMTSTCCVQATTTTAWCRCTAIS